MDNDYLTNLLVILLTNLLNNHCPWLYVLVLSMNRAIRLKTLLNINWTILQHIDISMTDDTFSLKCLLFKKGQNVEVQVFSPLTKNLQFLSEFAQTFRDLSTHGHVKPWKFEQNWMKIVDFLLMVKKICTSTFWPF